MTSYSREDWGARLPRARYPLDPAQVEGIALHWPAMVDELAKVDQVKAALRDWQRYHMDSRGWSDIAYQVAVDQAGNWYQLRGLRHRSGANGDDLVNQRFGALLLVLAEDEQPTPEMIRTTRARIARFQHIFPRGVRIVGHQDVRPEPTSCPGPAVMDLIHAGRFTPKRHQ
jgi:hypothetical protein